MAAEATKRLGEQAEVGSDGDGYHHFRHSQCCQHLMADGAKRLGGTEEVGALSGRSRAFKIHQIKFN